MVALVVARGALGGGFFRGFSDSEMDVEQVAQLGIAHGFLIAIGIMPMLQ